MKVKITVEEDVEVKYFAVSVGVRYWDDTTVNGVEDTDGTLIPCREGFRWKPFIDIDKGKILNWKQGTTADIRYKVCDDGVYQLLDENEEILLTNAGYVPDIMCPEGDGYGNYIIMKVDKDGFIANWNNDIDDLLNEY